MDSINPFEYACADLRTVDATKGAQFDARYIASVYHEYPGYDSIMLANGAEIRITNDDGNEYVIGIYDATRDACVEMVTLDDKGFDTSPEDRTFASKDEIERRINEAVVAAIESVFDNFDDESLIDAIMGDLESSINDAVSNLNEITESRNYGFHRHLRDALETAQSEARDYALRDHIA